MHLRLAAVAAGLVALVIAGCGGEEGAAGGGGESNSTDPIKLGAIHDLSGPIAPYGESLLNGSKLAIKEANADGGVLGRQIELQTEDSGSDKATMPTGLRKLANDGAAAIIGPTGSSALVVGAPVANQLERVLIAPSSSDRFEDGVLNDWTFRVAPTESAAFADLFSKMKAMLGFQRVALFYDDANNASITERKLLEEHQEKLGYELVAVETSPEGRTDVSGPVSKVLAANPDVIFIAHLVPESAAFMKQVRARDKDVAFVGGAPFATSKIFEIAGEAGEGSLTYLPYLPTEQDTQASAFISAYQTEYGAAPDQFGALGYDAATVLMAAIEKAGSDDPKAIRDALSQLKDVDAVTGSVSYNGGPENATPELKLVKVEGGKFVPVE
jgi:branched-chain amino acid transport system substrate-binding protein